MPLLFTKQAVIACFEGINSARFCLSVCFSSPPSIRPSVCIHTHAHYTAAAADRQCSSSQYMQVSSSFCFAAASHTIVLTVPSSSSQALSSTQGSQNEQPPATTDSECFYQIHCLTQFFVLFSIILPFQFGVVFLLCLPRQKSCDLNTKCQPISYYY